MDNLFSPAIILCKLPCWQYFSLSHFESVPRIILTRFWFSGSNLKEESPSKRLHSHLNFSCKNRLLQVKYKVHLKSKWHLSHLPVDFSSATRNNCRILPAEHTLLTFPPQDASSRIGTKFEAHQKSHKGIWLQRSSHITKSVVSFYHHKKIFWFLIRKSLISEYLRNNQEKSKNRH